MYALDPETLQDFLTESSELIEQLESDLVVLERTPSDPDLINTVFRALHTIKGSSSFLDLTNLVKVAHAAESALSAARNKQAVVDRPMMDLLLQVVDLVKIQIGQVRAGQDLTAPDETLVNTLKQIGEGKQSSLGSVSAVAAPSPAAVTSAPAGSDEWVQRTSMKLGPGKAELADFMADDAAASVTKIGELVVLLDDPATRLTAAADLTEACHALAQSADFFELDMLTRLTQAIGAVAQAQQRPDFSSDRRLQLRLAASMLLLKEQAEALTSKQVVSRRIETFIERMLAAASGASDPATQVPEGATAQSVLVADGVFPPETPGAAGTFEDSGARAAVGTAGEPQKIEDKKGHGVEADHTIRVEVGRLEALMNLVGELVLQKNRIQALIRAAGAKAPLPGELKEQLTAAGGGLDRVTSDMQVAVLRTRMQPLEKLFGKYPRLIRDLASKTGKQIELRIEGGETEVDKSVIEELGDPLVHLMRNAADHGLEAPDERIAAGKPPQGTIRLVAKHEGGNVSVQVIDDGRGLTRDRIGRKAVERGLVAAEALTQMSDSEVFRFIFLPGFSTAEQVSDLSGRGVGMDVVRTNIEKLKGTIDLSSTPGRGTTVAIKIPLTVAIMPAMMVGVGKEIYAVPLESIVEIVRPESAQLLSIGEHPVLRLRDQVLPLISAAEVFDLPDHHMIATPFVVVLEMNEKRVGLMVARPIGQQEVVIKSLEQLQAQGAVRGRTRGPIAGATVRDDGNVSLIVDVAELIRRAENTRVKKAA